MSIGLPKLVPIIKSLTSGMRLDWKDSLESSDTQGALRHATGSVPEPAVILVKVWPSLDISFHKRHHLNDGAYGRISMS